jgi:hypothetical protein
MAGNSDIIDIEMELHHETDKAVLVSLDGNSKKAIWLPKSAIEIEKKKGSVHTVSLPEKLAYDKGLI